MINLNQLYESTGSDPELLNSLLKEFVHTTETDIASLKKAVRLKQATIIASLSHRIKGSSMIIGAEQLTSVAQKLENAARQQNNIQFDLLFSDLEAVCIDVITDIQSSKIIQI